MKTTSFAASLLVAATAFVAGCDGPVTVNSWRGGANPMFTYAAADRDLHMDVIGNPFASPKEQLEVATVDAMQGRIQGQPTHLTTSPSASARTDSRLVIAFDALPSVSAEKLCITPDPAAVPLKTAGSARLESALAFCYRETPYAEVRGSMSRPQSPTDPAFRRLVSAMATSLLPGSDSTMFDIMSEE